MQELTKRKIEYNFIWSGQHKQKIDKHLKNFNIKNLRIVNPRCEWPNQKALATSVGAKDILKSLSAKSG